MPTNSPYIIGTIEQHEGRNVILTLVPNNEHPEIAPDSHVTVWNQPNAGGPAAMFQGRLTELSGATAAFVVTESDVPPDWPDRIDPLGEGNPVYAAVPGTYIPDMSRMATNSEMKLMVQLARDHEEKTSLRAQGGIITATLLRTGLEDEEAEEAGAGDRAGAGAGAAPDGPQAEIAVTVTGAGDLDLDLMESVSDLNIMNEQARREEKE